MSKFNKRLFGAVFAAGLLMSAGGAWAAIPTTGADGPVIGTATTGTGTIVSTDPVTVPDTFGPPLNPETEANWATAVLRQLGLIGATDSVSWNGKAEDPAGCGSGSCSVGNPTSAAFAYFIVKDATEFYLFRNTNGNALAEFGWGDGFPSHVTFLTPIPPAIALLLSAIGGLFGLGWFRRRKAEAVAAA